eukprot:Selendium_serpulae@DN4342_c0_g1_i2.p1
MSTETEDDVTRGNKALANRTFTCDVENVPIVDKKVGKVAEKQGIGLLAEELYKAKVPSHAPPPAPKGAKGQRRSVLVFSESSEMLRDVREYKKTVGDVPDSLMPQENIYKLNKPAGQPGGGGAQNEGYDDDDDDDDDDEDDDEDEDDASQGGHGQDLTSNFKAGHEDASNMLLL